MQSKPSRSAGSEKPRIISDRASNFLEQRARIIKAPQGAHIFDPDIRIDNMCLLLSGTLRVERPVAGREPNAHYQVCCGANSFIASACLISLENRSARVVAETDVEAMLVRRDDFDALLVLSKQFRAFVFDAYSRQITNLFDKVDEAILVQSHILPLALEIKGYQGLSH